MTLFKANDKWGYNIFGQHAVKTDTQAPKSLLFHTKHTPFVKPRGFGQPLFFFRSTRFSVNQGSTKYLMSNLCNGRLCGRLGLSLRLRPEETSHPELFDRETLLVLVEHVLLERRRRVRLRHDRVCRVSIEERRKEVIRCFFNVYILMNQRTCQFAIGGNCIKVK